MTYKVQIDDVVRPATADEISVIESQIAAQEKAEADREAALEARKAPLRRLGLTDDEINIVLGV